LLWGQRSKGTVNSNRTGRILDYGCAVTRQDGRANSGGSELSDSFDGARSQNVVEVEPRNPNTVTC
jgi:hypothetical protein